jgi:hypothetical protein
MVVLAPDTTDTFELGVDVDHNIQLDPAGFGADENDVRGLLLFSQVWYKRSARARASPSTPTSWRSHARKFSGLSPVIGYFYTGMLSEGLRVATRERLVFLFAEAPH